MSNRALGRDVHIYDANDPTGPVLGGLILTNSVTNANFYSMVEIIFIFDKDYFLRDETGTTLQRDGHLLQPGSYYIVTTGSFPVNDEPWLVRTVSVASKTRVASFQDAVRGRDRQCAITGQRALNVRGEWTGFEAAHIFPLEYEGHWNEHNYGRWITIQSGTGGSSINSVQNGILLRADVHALFER